MRLGLELHSGVEESHGFSFRVVEGAAFLSNGLCRSMVDYVCENFVKPMNFYEVIRFAEMCRCACWCSSQTTNTLWPGRLGFPSAVVQRATPLARWALLFLATRFASPFDRVRTLAAGYSGTLRGAPAMPGDAIEPDEPPTWAGEQHRRCRARVDREGCECAAQAVRAESARCNTFEVPTFKLLTGGTP